VSKWSDSAKKDFDYLHGVILNAGMVIDLKNSLSTFLRSQGISKSVHDLVHADLKNETIATALTGFYYGFLFRQIDFKLNHVQKEPYLLRDANSQLPRRLGAGLMSVADYSVLASGAYKAGPGATFDLFNVNKNDVTAKDFDLNSIIEKSKDSKAKDYMKFIESCLIEGVEL
jgi:hypothetical protein